MCEARGTSGSTRGPSVLGTVVPYFACVCVAWPGQAAGLSTQGRRRPPLHALRQLLAPGPLPGSGDDSLMPVLGSKGR